jgi:hypothetical protein
MRAGAGLPSLDMNRRYANLMTVDLEDARTGESTGSNDSVEN